LTCINEADLNRQLIKSDSASVLFPSLDFEIPPKTQKGEISTIEGFISTGLSSLLHLSSQTQSHLFFLSSAARNLSLYQRERMEHDPAVGAKVAQIIGS
jgi:C4-type Zn-finger protein